MGEQLVTRLGDAVATAQNEFAIVKKFRIPR